MSLTHSAGFDCSWEAGFVKIGNKMRDSNMKRNMKRKCDKGPQSSEG